MIQIDIIAVGRLRDDALLALWHEYTKRLQWPLSLYEIESRKKGEDTGKLLAKIDNQSFLFVMDERGKSLASTGFAEKIQNIANDGITKIQFIIGGADGLPSEIREKADFLLSFGAQTWPHMLARIMLAEQVYRAQQIIAGHPYHRE